MDPPVGSCPEIVKLEAESSSVATPTKKRRATFSSRTNEGCSINPHNPSVQPSASSSKAHDESVMMVTPQKKAYAKREPQKKAYAKRGTAGTFNGKRPPKCPIKMLQFLREKEEYLQTLAFKKERASKHKRKQSPTQERFREHLRQCLRKKSGATRRRFADAVASWRKLESEKQQD